jgi:hypothetical protein
VLSDRLVLLVGADGQLVRRGVGDEDAERVGGQVGIDPQRHFGGKESARQEAAYRLGPKSRSR